MNILYFLIPIIVTAIFGSIYPGILEEVRAKEERVKADQKREADERAAKARELADKQMVENLAIAQREIQRRLKLAEENKAREKELEDLANERDTLEVRFQELANRDNELALKLVEEKDARQKASDALASRQADLTHFQNYSIEATAKVEHASTQLAALADMMTKRDAAVEAARQAAQPRR